MAKAKVAIVESRFRDALDLATINDADQEREKTEMQIRREFQLLAIRADSFYGLREWENARAAYSRMVELRPTDSGARSGNARCLYFLGRHKEALDILDALLAELTKKYKHGSETLGRDIATSLANRAGILAEQGDLTNAASDLSAAIDMFQKNLQRMQLPMVSVDLAKTLLRRGGIQADQRNFSDALKDIDRAEAMCTILIANGAEGECDTLLPSILHDKATVLVLDQAWFPGVLFA